jgi:phosphate transport system substrate-binding protein
MMTGISLSIAGGGSSIGVESVGNGALEVGMSSRPVNSTEEGLYSGIRNHTICLDGIAVIVHPNNTITGLTKTQIREIFNGTITDWATVGGTAGAITVVNRDSTSGIRSFFKEDVMDGDEFVVGADELTSNGEVHVKVAGNESAIGFVGLSYLDSDVKALEVDGVAPSVATVADLSYPIIQSLYLITIGEIDAQSPEVQELFGFLLSRIGQYIANDEGFVALTEYAGGALPA